MHCLVLDKDSLQVACASALRKRSDPADAFRVRSGLADVQRLCCRGKTNFFERRVGEYQKNGVMAGLTAGGGNNFALDEDF